MSRPDKLYQPSLVVRSFADGTGIATIDRPGRSWWLLSDYPSTEASTIYTMLVEQIIKEGTP